MVEHHNILLLNLPHPKNQKLWRESAGGFGSSVFNPCSQGVTGKIPFMPFFAYASSILIKEGYTFSILDAQKLNLNNEETIKAVENKNPNIIFSVLSLPSMKNDLEILDQIKKAIPDVIIVGVGTVCRVLHNEILLGSNVDVLLRSGYPYVTNMDILVNALSKSQDLKNIKGISYVKNSHVHNAELIETELNDLPKPCFDYISVDGYDTFENKYGETLPFLPVVDSIGCPYDCFYCPYPIGFGHTYSCKPISTVIDEIEELYNLFNIRVFDFRSQAFAYDRKRAMKLCNEIIRRKLDIGWICETRLDELNRKTLDLMVKSGCQHMCFGVETGDPKILKIAKTGADLEFNKKMFSLTKKMGVKTQANIVLGFPDDNRKTLGNTRKYILALDPDVLNLNYLTPYPGTKVLEVSKRKNLVLTSDWSKYTSHQVVMRTKELSASDLEEFKVKIIRDFSKQKLNHLVRNTFSYRQNPRLFAAKTKNLVYKILFPTD